MSSETRGEGWAFPGNSRKAHYMRDSTALCRRWGFYNGPLQQGNDGSPDNCAECKRQRLRELPTQPKPQTPS